MLAYAYYKVTGGIDTLNTFNKIAFPILLGVISTFLIFWSLSGFILKLAQSRKSMYLKGTNLFVLRQIHNKINTTVVSMTIICLLLFMTISVLSSALSLNNVLTKDLEEMTPVDLNLCKTANLPEDGDYTEVQIEDSRLKISDTLKNVGFDMNVLKDIVEIDIYATNDLTWKDTLGDAYDEVKALFPHIPSYDYAESIIKVSDYNQVARAYGMKQYELKDNEYIILCDFQSRKDLRDKALAYHTKITIAGKEYSSKYTECQPGFLVMSGSHMNPGIILVPDSCGLTEDMKEEHLLIANYNADTQEGKEKIEQMFTSYSENSKDFMDQIIKQGIPLDGMTKISIYESSKGIATVVTFIAIYLGVVFLIASSAILALKELTENSDNRQRYTVLRKIGVDESMINRSLFKQIAIFFIVPLVLAVIHSIFGIQFALKIISVEVHPKEMLSSVIATAVFLVVIYGGYFLATYTGSKNIIKEE